MKRLTRKTISYFGGHLRNSIGLSLLLLFAIVVGEICVMIWPYFFAQFFDSIATGADPATLYDGLISILLKISIVGFFFWISYQLRDFTNRYLLLGIRKKMVAETFDYLHGHSYRFFTDNFSGSLVKKFSRIVRAFESIVDKFVFSFLPTAVRLLIALAVMFFVSKLLFAAILIWTALFITVNYLLSVYKLKHDIARSKAETRVSGALADTVVNNFNIKIFANLPAEKKSFASTTEDWCQKSNTSWRITNYIDALQSGMMVSLEIFVMFLTLVLWRDGLVTVGVFWLVQAYVLEIFQGLWNFGRDMRDVYERFADAEEMIEILDQEHEVQDQPNAKKFTYKGGKIEFKNVYFAYKKEGESVLNDFSLKIKPSEKVALVGPSGGGKSTIIKLILRLFDLNAGQILIDGQDIAQVTQSSLRREIALVPQSPILFHRSLRENIRYGNLEASDQAIEEAAKLAFCHDFIQRLPEGYDTYVGERGVKLSGGQRQRVAIARAILSNARILILDEATSSLDSESELLIQKALDNLMKNKTVVMIAHRLSTIRQADRIFVIRDGAIIEEGSHADLLKAEKDGEGLYRKLWDIQRA